MMTGFSVRYTTIITMLAGLLLTSGAALADAPSGPDKAAVVLPAGVEKKIEAAFARAAPAWTLQAAKVQKDSVEVKVCDQANSCTDLTLSDPKGACKGKVVGPWCVTYKGAAPAQAAALEGALAKDAISDMWKVIPARPPQPAEAPSDSPDEATGSQNSGERGGSAGGHGDKGDKAGPSGGGGGGGQGGSDNTGMLLIVALISAAVATFALFRLRDDEEDEAEPSEAADEASGDEDAADEA